MPLRFPLRFAFALVCFFGALRAATPPAPTPPPAKLGSTIFRWADLIAKATPKGELRQVANHPTPTLARFECHITTLNPGQASHEPHRHPQEEMILVKEGRLEVHINGATQVCGPGSVFFYAWNDAHAVRNVGESRATYWVINLATAKTQDPYAINRAPSLGSGVHDWAKLTVLPTKTGERREILKGSTATLENLTCHVTTLNPREAAHGAHRHPDDEIVIVREGEMEAMVNGQTTRGAAGSVFLFTSNDLHGMRNAGDTRASYYVIRVVTTATPKS